MSGFSYPTLIESVFENINHGVKQGVLHLETSETNNQFLGINNNRILNFSSYSYLGLEENEEMKNAGCAALKNYGTQFGYSRAYLSIDLYSKLEKKLSKIFKNPTIVAPSTTLAHQAVLPVLINENDLVIVDQHAHSSIHYTLKTVKSSSVRIELLRHNRIDLLRDKIKDHQGKKGNIWYLCDGVYSMHGDTTPVNDLEILLNEFDNFYVYVDDAHGMSWIGENGSGYVLSKIELHRKMLLVTSLNKSFCASGGAIVSSNLNWIEKIRSCGGPMIFSTPIPPVMLGIAYASAELHLRTEFVTLQKKLTNNIDFCNRKIQEIGIPQFSETRTPVFFIPTGLPMVSFELTSDLMKMGIYVSPAVYPAVSANQSGLRFCLTAEHTESQILKLLKSIKHCYSTILDRNELNLKSLLKPFRKEFRTTSLQQKQRLSESGKLTVFVHQNISELNAFEWNDIFSSKGNFDSEGLRLMEQTFRDGHSEENQWDFFYITIRDQDENLVLATFFTLCLCKDDMFKAYDISKTIEKLREQENPHYLCSKVLMMGSLMSEGDHFYINSKHPLKKGAVIKLLNVANEIKRDKAANAVYLRDFILRDDYLHEVFLEYGFVRSEIPDYSNTLELGQIKNFDEYFASLNSKRRQQIKGEAIKFEDKYQINVLDCPTEKSMFEYYDLYMNVKRKSLLLNTFDLPLKLFLSMRESSSYEFLELRLQQSKTVNNDLIAVVFCFKNKDIYVPLFVGLDYQYLYSHKNYKQAVYQIVQRAIRLKAKRVYFGFTASTEKKRYGAFQEKKYTYSQIDDPFNFESIELSNSYELIQ